MKALITGIEGFVGPYLARHLAGQGLQVWGTVRHTRPAVDLSAAGVEGVLRCDVTVADDVEAALEAVRPDRIFHLAGHSFVPTSWEDPGGAFRANLFGTLEVLACLDRMRWRGRMLHVGSGQIYGTRGERDGVAEDSPCDPTSPYALSKLSADLLCRMLADRSDLDVVRVRPFNHTGPGQRAEFALPAFCAQIARAEAGLAPPVLKVGNLDVDRDVTDVRDMVVAYGLALDRGRRGGLYNLGRGTPVLMREAVEILVRKACVPIRIEVDPNLVRPGESKRLLADTSAFEADTGWRPMIPLEQTLTDLLTFWRVRIRSGSDEGTAAGGSR